MSCHLIGYIVIIKILIIAALILNTSIDNAPEFYCLTRFSKGSLNMTCKHMKPLHCTKRQRSTKTQQNAVKLQLGAFKFMMGNS